MPFDGGVITGPLAIKGLIALKGWASHQAASSAVSSGLQTAAHGMTHSQAASLATKVAGNAVNTAANSSTAWGAGTTLVGGGLTAGAIHHQEPTFFNKLWKKIKDL